MTRTEVQHMSKSLTIKVCKIKGYWKRDGRNSLLSFVHSLIRDLTPQTSFSLDTCSLGATGKVYGRCAVTLVNTNLSSVSDAVSELVFLTGKLMGRHKLKLISTRPCKERNLGMSR